MKDVSGNETKKPTYQDYKMFLQTYGTKSEALSSTSSGQSENDVTIPKTYNEFLRNYGSKKFGSVRMKNGKKDDIDGNVTRDEKKMIRSELIVNINPGKGVENDFKSTSPRLSPKPVDNTTVSDQMIYAKTAVLEELLSHPAQLKKPSGTTSNIYKRLEQFTLQNDLTTDEMKRNLKSNESSPIPPPPPPAFPPPLSQLKNVGKGDTPTLTSPKILTSPKPAIPQKTFTKSDLKEDKKYAQQQFILTQLDQNNGMLSNVKTVVPVVDANVEVDKKDPNVKKLVYNTYRGMLGAYNNKANNMVSTLPRNFVVQDKGVGKQLESIAAQGCLTNLNGRVNPNPED